jgi:hypothetical protein
MVTVRIVERSDKVKKNTQIPHYSDMVKISKETLTESCIPYDDEVETQSQSDQGSFNDEGNVNLNPKNPISDHFISVADDTSVGHETGLRESVTETCTEKPAKKYKRDIDKVNCQQSRKLFTIKIKLLVIPCPMGPEAAASG